jgi:NADPH:quinone reductase-like Zn-dependent oxidoreductase
MSNIPKTQSAVTVAENKTVKVTNVPTPKITKPDQVLIKVYAAAQNPTDGDSVQVGMVKEGRIIGNDLAGKVVEIGDAVKNVKVGDRVEPEST